jgi:hypothetical protein
MNQKLETLQGFDHDGNDEGAEKHQSDDS